MIYWQTIYPEINWDYSFPYIKQHKLNYLTWFLLSYSGFWMPNKIGHHQLGPNSSILLFKGHSRYFTKNIPAWTEYISIFLLHLLNYHTAPSIRIHSLLFFIIFSSARSVTSDHNVYLSIRDTPYANCY